MSEEYKRRQLFPLRLSPSMRREANELAHREGISLNHFISLAVAEKLSRMEHNSWIKEQNGVKQEKVQPFRITPDKRF
jgi:hypothetical protein